VPDEDGPKVDWLREHVGELARAGERVVIFCTYKEMVRLLAERFAQDGISAVVYTGDENESARSAAVAAFTDPHSPVRALLATDAAAEGLNLGTQCSRLINVDLPDTASRLEQRANRIHRVDVQSARYEVTHLVLDKSIETGVLAMLARKAATAAAVLGDRPTAVTGLLGAQAWRSVIEGHAS
jgi:superfamily II DNA/RNA helicase